MGKRANPMAVKAALTYEIGEAERALGKSPATIRNWVKDGLPIMAQRRPYLISGAALRDYLRTKYSNSKSQLAFDELLCMACRQGRKPCNMEVERISNNSKTCRLKGTCDHCGASAARIISMNRVPEFVLTFRFKKGGGSDAY